MQGRETVKVIEKEGVSDTALDNDHGTGTLSSILLRSFPEGETPN